MKMKDTIIDIHTQRAWGLFDTKGRLVEVKIVAMKPHFNNFETSRNWFIAKPEASKYQIEEISIARQGSTIIGELTQAERVSLENARRVWSTGSGECSPTV